MAQALPDYVLDPDAVLKDTNATWRYKSAPDYSKTRKLWEEEKTTNHTAGSLENLVENLVKNWEVEASFKTKLEEWRTIEHKSYTFRLNGGPAQTGEHMLQVGTYNALIPANEYYDPKHNDFSQSHKTFKRMMPTFAWEVIDVYSGPPTVTFKWRHWGHFKNDYVGMNQKGEQLRVKAHGGVIAIEGVIVAKVNESLQLQSIDVWFDPMEMFRQIVKEGGVTVGPVRKQSEDETDGKSSTVVDPVGAAEVIANASAVKGCPVMHN